MVTPPRRGRWIAALLVIASSALLTSIASAASRGPGENDIKPLWKIVLLPIALPAVALLLSALWWPRVVGWLLLAACALVVLASFVLTVQNADEPGAEWLVVAGLLVAALPALAGYLLVSSAKPARSASDPQAGAGSVA